MSQRGTSWNERVLPMNPQQATMTPELTKGTCQIFKNATPDDLDIFNAEYIVQFLSLKKVGTTGNDGRSGFDRYRIIMSDGTHYMQAMLATQLNSMVQENQITKGSIVVLERLTCNYVQEKRLVIVLGLRVLLHSAERRGDPQSIEGGEPATPSVTSDVVASTSSGTNQVQPVAVPPPVRPVTKLGRSTIFPIEGLSPYQNNWTIKARVTQKSDIKTWSNARGEGKLFNVTLMDDSGEIRATAFNFVVDDLYPRLEEGKVYYISKARVNLAKKKFSNVNNDYELGLDKNTEVEECHETTNLPTIKYSFVQLNQLEAIAKDAICDVIGVVKESAGLTEVNSVKLNKQIPKRDLTLVDDSGFSVRLTLWGKQAEQYQDSEHPVIAVKGVKVGEYQGRTLSMISSSTMQINPDIKECFALRGWYDSQGSGQNFKSHTSANTMSSAAGFNRTELLPLDEVKQAGYGLPGNPEYFSARGTVMHIKSDTVSYPACANDGCNKKVEEVSDFWRCEKCDQSFSAPKHRYIMSMAVSDCSGQAWLQGFNDVGEVVFGMTANDLLEIKARSEGEYNAIVAKACGHTYNFACRAKQDTWRDTARIRYGISRIAPLDYREEAGILRDLLYSQWAR